MDELANELGEKTLFGRTGGAATLAVGMAHIFSKAVNGRWLDLWYHFAIMFEALFILTTVDAGTRVGRYLLQNILGRAWKPLGDPKNFLATPVAAALMVGAWGYFLIQGVRDPLGGVNSLWPLFGIANQMLAAIALCLAVTIILKMELRRDAEAKPEIQNSKSEMKTCRPWLALVALLPMIWLVSVTFTAGVQKIWHPDPRIGFLAQADLLKQNQAGLKSTLATATAAGEAVAIESAEKALRTNLTLRFNNLLDAIVAGTFLGLVSIIVVFSVREWILLLSRRKQAVLRETEPVWLPDYAVAEGGRKFDGIAGAAALTFALAKELSGEGHLDRAQQQAGVWDCSHPQHDAAVKNGDKRANKTAQQLYVEVTEQRFKGVRRCC